jgi:hypothetical protein
MPIDQFHDPSFKRLYHLFNEHPESEEHIKTAQLDLEENEKRADSAFAWPERRMFPIDTPAQAALSRLYMEKQASVPDYVRQNCEKALTLYGVDMPLQEKIAAAPDLDEYLLPERKRFRVTDAETVKLASEAVLRNQRKMDATTRAQACVGLVKKSMQYETPLDPKIYKMAGVTMSYLPEMRTWLEARAAAVTDPMIKAAYEKLAEVTKRKELFFSDRDELVKIASVIDELDQASGLNQWYDRRLPDPMQTVFNTNKVAEEMFDVATKQVPASVLAAVPPEAYVDAFGDDIAGDFTEGGVVDTEKLRTLWDSIPLDLKQALVAQLGL